jgi:hypothetical protein
MAQDSGVKIVCLKVSGPERMVRAFLSKYPQEANSVRREGDSVSLEICVPEQLVKAVGEAGLKAEVMFDASARGLERQREVGQGNRYELQRAIPKGLGVRTGEEQK